MLSIRLARKDDEPAIAALMKLAIEQLQQGYLTPEQIEASKAGMGLDALLIEDGTYFCVEDEGELAGCGGWSRRATLYGGNHSAGRDPRLLDPASERARIRAMYTHPDHVRKGVGRLVLETAEGAARAEGFREIEMAATMAGKPFYERCGYAVESEWHDTNGAVPVPLATMAKAL
ncbi:GNAT family N-acetyltransferase [Qipengyuania sp. 1XM1-15A]|uniref:GNAT family N-acetyltransferase n=1 Tax=Qipengyuania xiamenensis TaxID=2867237 RepID=UPI001C888049|nr:GNAT family N-acetyltransferase [Qipengyuania xiamenensis]MBX7533819.1 GNAT family N-acetyltransferase [Qipengyuania xiamenensis]